MCVRVLCVFVFMYSRGVLGEARDVMLHGELVEDALAGGGNLGQQRDAARLVHILQGAFQM